MDVKDIRRLLEALEATDVREFHLEAGDYKMTLKRGPESLATVSYLPAPEVMVQAQTAPAAQPAQAGRGAPAAAATAPVAAPAGPKLQEVLAPIVGTFYSAPSPDAPPFVKVGDRVSAGTVLCIIEAMKLMNEIEAETAGIVREASVSNGDPVEYGQVLFRIEPA